MVTLTVDARSQEPAAEPVLPSQLVMLALPSQLVLLVLPFPATDSYILWLAL